MTAQDKAAEYVHGAADFIVHTMIGGVVGYWTRSPIAGQFASQIIGPHVADFVENVSLDVYGNLTSYPSLSLPVTSTTGRSQERKVKKQMSSTSRSYSYRRRYYPKKRKYYRY